MSENYVNPHLNIFYGFSQGGFNTLDDLSVLESNVTRAFIITLMNSEPDVLRELLKKFIDKNSSSSNPKYALERNFESLPEDFQKDKKKKKKIVLIITPRGEKPDPINPNFKQIIDKLNQNNQLLSNQQKNKIISECRNLRKKSRDNFNKNHNKKLKTILEKYMKNIQTLDFSIINFNQFRYIIELFRGSRPDAWIVSNDILILIEVKIHGELDSVQINRHINENLNWASSKKPMIQSNYLNQQELPINKDPNFNNPDYVWKIVLSWRFDLFHFFTNLLKNKSFEDKTNFLINEFNNFLEEIGMGKLTFNSQDFDSVKNPSENLSQLRSVRDRMEDIAIITFKKYPKLKTTLIQKVQADSNYVGVNIGENTNARDDIHFSFGMDNIELRIYLTIQMKPLIEKLIKTRQANKSKFDREFTTKLISLKPINDFYNAYLDIEDRWHLISGRNYYFKDARVPIYPDDDLMSPLVTMIMNHLENLTDNVRIKLDAAQIEKWVEKYKGRSASGVLSIGYYFREPFCENLGEKIVDCIKIAIERLMPIYDFLKKTIH